MHIVVQTFRIRNQVLNLEVLKILGLYFISRFRVLLEFGTDSMYDL